MAAKKTAAKKTATKKAVKVPPKKDLLKNIIVTHSEPAATGGSASSVAMPEHVISKVTGAPSGEMAKRDAKIRALVQSMASEGHRPLRLAEHAADSYLLRCPTGIMEIDIDLAGGWPGGGMSIISGPDNSGKSWLLLRTMAQQQRIHGNDTRIAIAVTEGSFNYIDAINNGLCIPVPEHVLEGWQQWRRDRNMPLISAEEAKRLRQNKVGDIYVLEGMNGEEYVDHLIKMIGTGAFSLVACDSMNGLMPTADLKKESANENFVRAAHANLMKKFFMKYIPITTRTEDGDRNKTCVLFTRQVRSNQERANAPSHIQAYLPENIPSGGGYAADHYKLIELTLRDGRVIKKEGETGKTAIGKEINWKTEKGKAGTHDNKTGSVTFYYQRRDADAIGALIVSGIQRGVIQQHGAEVVVVRPDTKELLPGYTAPSQAIFRRMLESDFDFELSLRREIFAAAGVTCSVR